jgi:hypothetical protein
VTATVALDMFDVPPGVRVRSGAIATGMLAV